MKTIVTLRNMLKRNIAMQKIATVSADLCTLQRSAIDLLAQINYAEVQEREQLNRVDPNGILRRRHGELTQEQPTLRG